MNGKKAKALRRLAHSVASPVAWDARGSRVRPHQLKGYVSRIELHPASGKRLYKTLKLLAKQP